MPMSVPLAPAVVSAWGKDVSSDSENATLSAMMPIPASAYLTDLPQRRSPASSFGVRVDRGARRVASLRLPGSP